MVHSHSVYDSDPHFIIDPISRAVTNKESKKTILMQYDHNSECFSFEVSRLVEGHDLTLCNRVEVHYTNTDSSTRESNSDIYEVTDLTVDPNDENKILFTWTISENATMYAGSLSFLIQFACIENDVDTYRWHTGINNSVSISKGMNNGDSIIEQYSDLLNQWKRELYEIVHFRLVVDEEGRGTLIGAFLNVDSDGSGTIG